MKSEVDNVTNYFSFTKLLMIYVNLYEKGILKYEGMDFVGKVLGRTVHSCLLSWPTIPVFRSLNKMNL